MSHETWRERLVGSHAPVPALLLKHKRGLVFFYLWALRQTCNESTGQIWGTPLSVFGNCALRDVEPALSAPPALAPEPVLYLGPDNLERGDLPVKHRYLLYIEHIRPIIHGSATPSARYSRQTHQIVCSGGIFYTFIKPLPPLQWSFGPGSGLLLM